MITHQIVVVRALAKYSTCERASIHRWALGMPREGQSLTDTEAQSAPHHTLPVIAHFNLESVCIHKSVNLPHNTEADNTYLLYA